MPKWLAWLAYILVKVWAWTFRVEVDDRCNFLARTCPWPMVAAVWHNRLLFFANQAPRSILERCAVLISPSRDGEYVSTFIKFTGMNVVRGSSSRGGLKGFLELMDVMEAQQQMAVLTVDGPRGPRYEPHMGAVALAQKSGFPIMPAAINARRRWEMKSWDKMQIPWPFAKVKVVFGKPLYISPEIPPEEALAQLKAALMEITDDSRT